MKISLREKLCYALGDASANIAWRGICTFLLVFYTDVVGLAPAVVATLMLVVRSFDGVTDILMGIVGDNTHSKYGKFRPWILWTAIPLAVILSLTFTCPPGLGMTGKIVYAYATYLLFTLVYTANNIPYGALMAVMTGDDRERASIGSFRMAGAFAGGMVVQGSLLYLKDYFHSYSIPIYLMSVVLAACLLITFFGTRERIEPPKEQKTDLLADLKQLITNVPWLVLLVVGLLFNVYNAVRQGITVIYFTHYLNRVPLCGAFLTAIMVASIFGALATGPLAKRFGKRRLFVVTLFAAAAVNALFAFCGPADIAAIFAIGIVGEAIAAVFPTLFFTMLGDAADYSEFVHGRRATGLVYSAGSFATKFGGGVAGFIVGIVLAHYGYVGTDPATIPGAIPGIKLLMGVIPAVIAVISAFLMFLYPLSDRRLTEITHTLATRRMGILVTVLFLSVGALAGNHDGEFVIAERGQAPQVAIVMPKAAHPAIRWAARDFVDHVEKMTGVKLTIAEQVAPTGMASIRLDVCDPEIMRDGFSLAVETNEVAIKGTNARGVAYGLFELLERFGGCGWYALSYSHVPKIDRFALPLFYHDSQIAAFESRESFWYDMNHSDALAFHLRENARMWVKTPPEFGGSPHRFGTGLGSAHTFGRLLPPDTYFEGHPEYYAWHDGRRVPDQICLTNPDTLRIVTSNLLAAIAADPEARYFGVSQNDNFCYCKCAACHAIEIEEDSYAGTILRFVNAIADEVRKVHPDKVVETLAYHYSRKPPKFTKPRDNVMICLCSIECDFAHSLATGTYEQNVAFRKDIIGWGQIAKKMYVWDYVTNFQHYLNPFPNESIMAENLRFYRNQGVTMMFEQGDMSGRHGDMASYKQWLLSKLMWNPDADVAALTKRFLRDYYGAGAPYVAQYLELRAQNATQTMPLRIFEEATAPRFTLPELDRMAALWQRAEEAVKDDPARLYNARLDSLSVDYARIRHLIAEEAKPYGVSAKTPNYTKVQPLARRFLSIRKTCRDGEIPLVENTEDAVRTLQLIERLASRGDEPLSEVGEELCMRLIFHKWGHYGEDPLAQDGKALSIKPGYRVWSGQVALCEAAFVPGEKYVLSLRVRVEPASGAVATNGVFTFGVCATQPKDVTPTIPGARTVRLEETSASEYRWFDLPAMTLTEDLSLWFRAAAYDKKPASQRIFVDAIRLRR